MHRPPGLLLPQGRLRHRGVAADRQPRRGWRSRRGPGGAAMRAEEAEARLRALADGEVAAGMLRFFKTGPGQYGEGDRFLGIKADPLKRLARECRELSLVE